MQIETSHSRKRLALNALTDKVPTASLSTTVEDIEKLLDTEKKDQFETINYIYVLGDDRTLKEVVSIREIFRNSRETEVAKIMTTDLVTVRSHSSQERAAMLSIKHNIKAIPVVDHDNRFLGVIPSDTILDILHREHIEDVLYEAGIGKSNNPITELINASAFDHLKRRLPWLIVGLFGGILAASIVSGFSTLIEELVLLAVFLPVIVYIGDAVGAQSQTIMIRSLAIDRTMSIKKYISRELTVGSTIGVIIGVFAGIISKVFWGDFTLALIVATSLFLTVLISSVIAIILPLLFQKASIDPAIGSGPIATVLRDILSIAIYFTIASFFLGRM